jgi:hypothetical protein
MRNKLTILLVLAIALCFLGFALTALAADKKKVAADQELAAKKAQAERAGAVAAKKSAISQNRQVLTGTEQETSIPLPRTVGPSVQSVGVPFITIQTGARELDMNNTWNRMIQRDGSAATTTGGTVHMTYGIFKNVAGQNNTYRYNVYNAPGFANAMKYADGTEPAHGATSMQNGGLSVQRGSNAAMMYGRGPVANAANSGTLVSLDGAQALGLFTLDSVAGTGATGNPLFNPLDPNGLIVDSANWVVATADFGGTGSGAGTIPDIWVTRSTDAGETWPVPVYRSNGGFVGECDIVSNGSNLVYIVSPADPADTGAFFTTEHPCYIKSTDGGVTWSSMTSITPFDPNYPLVEIGIDAIMIGDTLHAFWLEWDQGLFPGGPGGRVRHVAVFPSGLTNGPQKIADINIDGNEPDRSTTALGAGNGLWVHISSSYRPSPTPVLYCLWSQPPDNGSGGYADSTDPALTPAQYFGNFDIFCAASRNNGRSWDLPTNVTQTNAPGCNGTTIPCFSEDKFSAAFIADTLIYILAAVDKFPAFQLNGDPGPDTRLSDEHRLYLAPARNPSIVASCLTAASQPTGNLHLIPNQAPTFITITVSNTGLADLILDSVTLSGSLIGAGANGLLVTHNAVNGTSVPELASTNFTLELDPGLVGPAQQGLRTGQLTAYMHTNDGLSLNPTTSCAITVNAYVVDVLCLNSGIIIHSATNNSDIFSQGVVASQTGNGLFYPSNGTGRFFDGGVAIVNPAVAAGPKGLRQYFNDTFLRCVRNFVLDSLPDGGGNYNLYAKSLATGLQDSGVVWENIYEQSTNPAYSDFLVQTVKVANISGADIADAILGVAYDIDAPANAAINHGNVTSFVATDDGKTYEMIWISGGALADSCLSNDQYYGAVAIPNGTASTSPVSSRGAVVYNNRAIADNFDNTVLTGGDTLFTRYMDVTGTHVWDDATDSLLTGFTLGADTCSNFPSPGSFPIGRDLGYTMGVEKVTLVNNTVVGPFVARYGLEALAASIDTISLGGPVESYTVLHIGSVADLALLLEAADSAVSFYNATAGVQVGGGIGGTGVVYSIRGDMNGSTDAQPNDVVLLLNRVFVGTPIPDPNGFDCPSDLNFDGQATPTDVVLELNCVFNPPPGGPANPGCLLQCTD